MEILIMIGLYAVGAVLFVMLLLYVQGMRVALGNVFQKPNFKSIDRKDCPEYLIKFLELEEPKLLNLGFKYLYCVLSDPLVKRDTSLQYTFVYYHEGNKTYARLTVSEIPNTANPWYLGLRTEFTNGKKFMTVNGIRHMYIGSIPNTILLDARAPSLEKHLEFHLRQLAALNEGFIKEYSEKTNPNDILREETHFWHHYIYKLEEKGYIFRVSEDKYKMKTLAALGLVQRIIFGVFKQIRLEQRQVGRPKPLDFEFPVELEVETYLNLKDTYRKPLKETSRNLLHLVLVLILFAVPVGFIFTFKIAAVLAAVVLLHELGHLAVMYGAGFKNIKISPVPFSAASGVSEEIDIPLYKKVLAYFAGPLTGFAAVFLLAGNLDAWNFPMIPPQHAHWETGSLVLMLVFFINYFNLIPIAPLDGGWIFNIIFPVNSKLSKLRVIFNTLGIMGLLLTAIIFNYWELFILAMVFLYAAHVSYYPKPLMKWVKNELKNSTRELFRVEEADEHKKEYQRVKKIFLRLRQPPYTNYSFYKKIHLAKVAEAVINVPKASPKLIAGTILFYLVLISVPFFYTAAHVAKYGFHPGDFSYTVGTRGGKYEIGVKTGKVIYAAVNQNYRVKIKVTN